MDEALREQDLESLADELLESAHYCGVLAGIMRRDGDTGALRLEPLVGHLEPVFAPNSPTMVVGLIHAWVVNTKWTVRVYDTNERSMSEWRGLSHPNKVASTMPDLEVARSAEYPDGAPTPRFVVTGRDASNMPLGDLAKVLPLIKSDWSSQLRADRSEENTAFPQLKIKGEVKSDPGERSSAHIIRAFGGRRRADFLAPGDLSQLHNHHNRKLERLREDAMMPGGFLGSQTPSGEALREANAKFISVCAWYAKRLSRVLTLLVADLARRASDRRPARGHSRHQPRVRQNGRDQERGAALPRGVARARRGGPGRERLRAHLGRRGDRSLHRARVRARPAACYPARVGECAFVLMSRPVNVERVVNSMDASLKRLERPQIEALRTHLE